MSRQMSDYLLYRQRYRLGYLFIGLAVVSLLLVAGLFIPGGLSQDEMQSVVTSSALSIDSFEPASIVNLPYHILQRISIELFGVTHLSIKLPSLILGALSVLGMIILLRAWFRRNVAIIATILVTTTGQFLFIAQSGTPSIAYIFWSVWLLVAAMMVSRRATYGIVWKLSFFAIAALSLYTPLSFYILVALASAVILHPHLRYIVRRLSRAKLAFAILCALILVAPLGYAIILEPSVGLTLLGVPDKWPDIWANIIQVLKQYFDFVSPSGNILILPVYGLGSVILITLGILHLFTTKYTARSYIISAWVILLLPILVINPHFTSVTFVPALLLMAMGIHTLLKNWYRLFPRNPYARIAGLVPLAILIGGMVVSGVSRYTYGYLYDPKTTVNFSKDLRIINKQLANPDRGNTTIMVSDQETAFYVVVAKPHKNITVNPTTKTQMDTTIVSHLAYKTAKPGAPSLIITSGSTYDGDRFYIYKTDTK